MDWPQLLFYAAGIGMGVASGFVMGVLYAAGHVDFRLRILSRLCCYFGQHEWKGLKGLGWDECKACTLIKDVAQ